MRRRRLLASAGTIAGAALAGCLVGDRSYPAENSSDDRSDWPTATGDRTTPQTPGSPTSSFEGLDRSCGSGADVATVAFEGEPIRIEGTIEGTDACVAAAFDDFEFDGVMTVAIKTDRTDDEGLARCLTEFEYVTQFDFDGPVPDEVVVRHDGEPVAREQR